MHLEDQVNQMDLPGCEATMTHIADDTFDNQAIVLVNP